MLLLAFNMVKLVFNAITFKIINFNLIKYIFAVFGKALLQCLCCILPFLDKDLVDNLPYLVSSTISVLPPALHQDIVNALCYYVLPFTISKYLCKVLKIFFDSIPKFE